VAMTQRFLRSKKLRAVLWYEQDGKCAICGVPLPEHEHADHTVAFVWTRRTNVHEMQLVCPKCNLQKGSKMPFQFRRFQQTLDDLCRQIVRAFGKSRSQMTQRELESVFVWLQDRYKVAQ
jgi:hypothetical protein